MNAYFIVLRAMCYIDDVCAGGAGADDGFEWFDGFEGDWNIDGDYDILKW